ncbi:hypothetical protein RHGRI_016629 [Rhododendron griersonianum]|uniref:Uncharacterized protein n=1 Tax=Rhododendron griersonianum TaxID=479676 RepID=A0AAV6JUV7_9ERIC|nr:hypothetical protein RHGRI_016629 [Rhododendron griersonianum]
MALVLIIYLPEGGEILSSCSDNDESSRSQAKKGGSPNGATSSLPAEPTANHDEGMSVMVAQLFELPTSPTDETNQHLSLPNVMGSTGSTLIPSKKRVRGPTRGINVDKERKRLGHPIPVEIDRKAMAIVGDYATSVAYAIGESIRSHAPVRDIGWGDIDFGIKESIILRVGVICIFWCIIDVKCQALYREWKCTLHNHYKVINKEVSDPQNHPLYPGALGLSGIEGLEATSDPVIEEIQPITQTAIIEQLRSVTDTLATMQQNQSLLMETVLALQKKSTTPPPPQAETEGTHPTGSQTETRDNQIGEGAQNLQSKEIPTPPPEMSSQKIPSMGVGSAAVVQNTVNTTPVTLEQVRALIQSEKQPLAFTPDADL